MRALSFLLIAAAALAGCTLFGDRPCEPGRYACPDGELDPPVDLGSTRSCTLDNPCPLPTVSNSSPGGAAVSLVAVSGRDGEAWIAGSTGTSQGVLLHAQPGQPTRTVTPLPIANPRALTATQTGPLTLLISSQGSTVYQYEPLSGQLLPLSLDTGSCQGRINLTGAISGVLALSASDLWLVGAATNDAAAGLFRVRAGVCQVLPELQSAGLSFYGVWGTARSPSEPAERQVWTVGDSGAAVLWSFQGPDGSTRAQRFAIESGAPLRAVAGSPSCATADGTGACAFMITGSALYSARDAAPVPVTLPAALRAAELTSLFVDGESVWLVGTQAAAGFVARYKQKSAAWSYSGGLLPSGGKLRAAWGTGDGSLWIVGDQGTVLYVPASP